MSTGMPRYQQVFSVLRQRIEEGHYRAGEKLLPEEALAATWGVSRATLRAAMAELEQLGLVVRQQGRGTFVCGPRPARQGPTLRGSLDDLITATRLDGTVDVRIESDIELPSPVAQRLGIPGGRGTAISRRRLDGSGRPYGWLVNYLSSEVAGRVTAQELEGLTLLQVLEREGVVLGGAEQLIRARVADLDVAEALDIEVGAPVVSVERLVVDESGAPVELLLASYRSDAYEYRVTFTR